MQRLTIGMMLFIAKVLVKAKPLSASTVDAAREKKAASAIFVLTFHCLSRAFYIRLVEIAERCLRFFVKKKGD